MLHVLQWVVGVAYQGILSSRQRWLDLLDYSLNQHLVGEHES